MQNGVQLKGGLSGSIELLLHSHCVAKHTIPDLEAAAFLANLDNVSYDVKAKNGRKFDPAVQKGVSDILQHPVDWIYGNCSVPDQNLAIAG